MIKNNLLTRYWIEMDRSEISPFYKVTSRFGITAYSTEDALFILEDGVKYFMFSISNPLQWIRSIKENIDISTFEDQKVIPNMGAPVWRGLWYPNLPMFKDGNKYRF